MYQQRKQRGRRLTLFKGTKLVLVEKGEGIGVGRAVLLKSVKENCQVTVLLVSGMCRPERTV